MWPPAGRKFRQPHFPTHLTKGGVASRAVSLSQTVSQTSRKDQPISEGGVVTQFITNFIRYHPFQGQAHALDVLGVMGFKDQHQMSHLPHPCLG